MRETSKWPWRFDGFGVNDFDGERIANLSSLPYLNGNERNEKHDNNGQLLAASPEVLSWLEKCVAELQCISDQLHEWAETEEHVDPLSFNDVSTNISQFVNEIEQFMFMKRIR